MDRRIVLLRGINLGPHNRIAMPALRELLTGAGFAGVRTYVQSGNIVVDGDEDPDAVAARCRELVAAELGVDVQAVGRTADDLAAVIAANPLGDVADDPKRYQVSFCASVPDPATVERLAALVAPKERFTAVGCELYAWHPDGVARSKLWNALADRRLGVVATARNWATVTRLHEMAQA